LRPPFPSKSAHPFVDRRQSCARIRPRRSGRQHCWRSRSRDARTIIFSRCRGRHGGRGFSIGRGDDCAALSRKRSEAAIEAFRPGVRRGSRCRGSRREARDEIYDKVRGFAGFGFPKSHSAAFAAARVPVGVLRHTIPRSPVRAAERAADGLHPPASLVGCPEKGRRGAPPDVNRSAAKARIEDAAVRVGLEYRAVERRGRREGARRGARTKRSLQGDDRARRAHRRESTWRRSSVGCLRLFGRPRRELLWELGSFRASENVPGSGGVEPSSRCRSTRPSDACAQSRRVS